MTLYIAPVDREMIAEFNRYEWPRRRQRRVTHYDHRLDMLDDDVFVYGGVSRWSDTMGTQHEETYDE